MSADRAAAVREGFREQARWCERLGSPFTARLCKGLEDVFDPATPIGRRVLDWPGDPVADDTVLAGDAHSAGGSGQACSAHDGAEDAALDAQRVVLPESSEKGSVSTCRRS